MQKINEDTDIIFDDSPDLKSNHLHVVSKSSFNQLNKIADKDVEEMLHSDLRDNDEHWLWGHVNRMKRSIFDFWGTSDEDQSKNDVAEAEQRPKNDIVKEEQPKKVHSTHKHHHKSQKKHKRKDDNLQQQNHLNHHAGHETISVDSKKEEKTFVMPRLYSTDRLKRQNSDDDDDESDNGWDIEENEVISSGFHDFDVGKDDFATKPHRLCKYFVTVECFFFCLITEFFYHFYL